MLVALASEFAAEAAMEAWVLLVELVTAVAMVAPVAWADVTCAEVTFRVVTSAAGGAEPEQQWGEDYIGECRQHPGHSELCAQVSNGTSHSWWLSRPPDRLGPSPCRQVLDTLIRRCTVQCAPLTWHWTVRASCAASKG